MNYPNWFEPYARPMFEKHLLPLAGKPGLSFLQIGAFTGDASVWLMENVLTSRVSWLEDVDTWRGSGEAEHESFDWFDVQTTYTRRVLPYAERVIAFNCPSEMFWRDAPPEKPFDFIYIDGDHTPYGVLNDAVAAYKVLKPGGLLAFDDYAWTDSRTGEGPKAVIDAFGLAYRGRLQLIQLGAQAWFRRIA